MRRPLIALALAALMAASALADSRVFTFIEDPAVTAAIRRARRAYLETAPHARLDVCVLLPTEEETVWRRGMVNGDRLAYPASCVKLAYLAAAMRWCRESGFPYHQLDEHVRPMIVESSNVATGHVVDIITGAPNLPHITEPNDEFEAWLHDRLCTERFLAERGLLGEQRVYDKTYPSNSGDWPTGAEAVAREVRGMNQMSPRLSASLMLEISHAAIEPEANAYMRELLTHERHGGQSFLGHGLPPGSMCENKPGVAYDTVEDIARIVLPNGEELIVAAFSDAREREQPAPAQFSRLGTFMDLLLTELDLRGGLPPRVRVAADDPARFTVTGHWSEGRLHAEGFGERYLYHTGDHSTARATWHLGVREEGFHEVAAWWPQLPDHAGEAEFVVEHAGGESSVTVDQRIAGGRWVPLGAFFFRAGEGAVHLLTRRGTPDQLVVADAVQATKIPPTLPEPGTDVIVDNDHRAPAFEYVGEDWGVSPWRGHEGLTYAYAHCGTPSRAIFRAPLTQPGTYAIEAHFRAGPNRATAASFQIETAERLVEVMVDQTGEGMVRRPLGAYRFGEGEAVVTLDAARSAGGDVVIADALRFRRVGD